MHKVDAITAPAFSALAAARARRDKTKHEISQVRSAMEEAYDAEEARAAIEEMEAHPENFLTSRRPLFRKAAALLKEEKSAALQIAQAEQQIRDHSMSPQDVMGEVRALVSKQSAELEGMREANAGLVERVAVLEAVVKALISLPQIAQSVTDVIARSQIEVEKAATPPGSARASSAGSIASSAAAELRTRGRASSPASLRNLSSVRETPPTAKIMRHSDRDPEAKEDWSNFVSQP